MASSNSIKPLAETIELPLVYLLNRTPFLCAATAAIAFVGRLYASLSGNVVAEWMKKKSVIEWGVQLCGIPIDLFRDLFSSKANAPIALAPAPVAPAPVAPAPASVLVAPASVKEVVPAVAVAPNPMSQASLVQRKVELEGQVPGLQRAYNDAERSFRVIDVQWRNLQTVLNAKKQEFQQNKQDIDSVQQQLLTLSDSLQQASGTLMLLESQLEAVFVSWLTLPKCPALSAQIECQKSEIQRLELDKRRLAGVCARLIVYQNTVQQEISLNQSKFDQVSSQRQPLYEAHESSLQRLADARTNLQQVIVDLETFLPLEERTARNDLRDACRIIPNLVSEVARFDTQVQNLSKSKDPSGVRGQLRQAREGLEGSRNLLQDARGRRDQLITQFQHHGWDLSWALYSLQLTA